MSADGPGFEPDVLVAAANAMTDILRDQAPPVTVEDGSLPGRTQVAAADGEVTDEIVVWIQDGKLSALEHAWYTEEPPAGWPEPHELSQE